jgi:CRP-like cAMP-binding protein
VADSTALGRNRLLNGLGGDDLARLQPHFKHISLTRGDALHPVGGPIKHVYFPEGGMISILTVMKSGELIETAIIGREGVVGGWVAIDGSNSNTQSTVQIEGSAWEIPTAKFLEAYNAGNSFRTAINKYQGIILFQAQQSAACHAIHTVEARLCRWILYSQDVTGSEEIVLTHEFLSHMLGVQRSSVSLCAHTLQESGSIRYSRGRIKILNRKGVEECACECYSVIRQQIDSVFPPPSKSSDSWWAKPVTTVGSGPRRWNLRFVIGWGCRELINDRLKRLSAICPSMRPMGGASQQWQWTRNFLEMAKAWKRIALVDQDVTRQSLLEGNEVVERQLDSWARSLIDRSSPPVSWPLRRMLGSVLKETTLALH